MKEEFLKLHYEPEHESGQTCWCRPKTFNRNGEMHIEHNEQRIILWDFIEKLLQNKELEIKEKLDSLAFENDDGYKVELFINWDEAIKMFSPPTKQ